MQNNPSPEKLNSHIRYLNTKKNNIGNQEVSHLFDQRIRSLTSDKIIVELGRGITDRDPSSVEKFDRFLRNVKSHIRNDTVKISNIPDNKIKKYVSRKNKIVSYDSYYFSLRNGFQLIKSLVSIDGCIALKT